MEEFSALCRFFFEITQANGQAARFFVIGDTITAFAVVRAFGSTAAGLFVVTGHKRASLQLICESIHRCCLYTEQ
jgi:hypothetical protein